MFNSQKLLSILLVLIPLYSFGTSLTFAPTIHNVPPDQIVECDFIPEPPLIGTEIWADSDCPGDIQINYTQIQNALSCSDNFELIRTWVAIDSCGISVTATQHITVEDFTIPTLTNIPGDITILCGDTPPPPGTPVATDNCDTDVLISFIETTSGNCPDAHHIYRTWDAQDNCGNLSSFTQTIFVEACDLNSLITVDLDYNGYGVSCYNGSDGQLTAHGVAGTPPYIYNWNNGLSLSTISGMPAGFYEVTITDALGCQSISNAELIEPSILNLYWTIGNETSAGSNDGFIHVTPTGGTEGSVPAYTYAWSNGENTDIIDALTAGTYQVTVTDANGCFEFAIIDILTDTVDCNMLYSYIDQPVLISCAGDSNAELTAIPSGGLAPYNFNWSTGATTETIFGLNAGFYMVTISDENACETIDSFEIFEPAPILLIPDPVHESFAGASDGIASVIVNGGVAPFYYNWGTGETTEELYNVVAGQYPVTVTDSEGCSNNIVVIVDVDSVDCSSLTVMIQQNHLVSCHGAADAELQAIVTGGVPPYSYFWNIGANTEIISGIPTGTYDVTVVDANGCEMTVSYFVAEPNPISLNTSAFNESAPNAYDGHAYVMPSGGVAPYVFVWSNGTTLEINDSLTAGTYFVTVYDDNQCENSDSVIIDTDPVDCSSLTVIIQQNQLVSCHGAVDAELQAIVTGGVPPYSYFWNIGANSEIISGIPTGTYDVTVVDVNGCEMTVTYFVAEPDPINLIPSAVNETNPGAANGQAFVEVIGGVPPYSYFWNIGSTDESLFGLTGGQYEVTVTDANGCNSNIVVNVITDCPITVSISEFNSVSCFGANDGELLATATGGIAPYSYSWTNGMTTDYITGLMSDYYELVVSDSIGCTVVTGYYLFNPQPLTLILNATNTSTNSASDGTATAIGYGGTGTFTFNWSNGATGDTIVNLAQGTYSVTMTDNTGCTSEASIIVGSDDPGCNGLDVSTTVSSNYSGFDLSCFSASDGSATATVSGGLSPYQYFWDNGQATATATGLPSGTYFVTVTDQNGCTGSGPITISPPPSLLATATMIAESTTGANDGEATVTAVGGTGNYSYLWNTGATTATISGLAPGAYTVDITDDNICTASLTLIIDAAIPDSDGDGIINDDDNCPYIANAGQEDSNNDGQGDACTCDPTVAQLPTEAGIHQSAFASYDGEWTHYCNADGELLLSLAKDNTGAEIPDTEIRLEIGSSITSYYGDSIGFVTNGLGGVFMNRNWDVQPTVQPTSNVGVKYYFRQAEFETLNTELAAYNFAPIPAVTDMQFFKVTNPGLGMFPPLPSVPTGSLELISNGASPSINTWAYASHGSGDHSAEYEVYSFSGGGGGGAEGGNSLPVELISFTGRKVKQNAELEWRTAIEKNNLGWEVQKLSLDGIWRTLGFVNGAMNTIEEQKYEFTDRNISYGNHYYRLKQMDVSGTFDYSSTVIISVDAESRKASVYPNPATDEFVLTNGIGYARIYNSLGLLMKELEVEEDRKSIDISQLKSGFYHIEITIENGKSKTAKFFKAEK